MGQKRFVDLSISIEPDLPSDPPIMIPKIDYIDHKQGAEQMKDFFHIQARFIMVLMERHLGRIIELVLEET